MVTNFLMPPRHNLPHCPTRCSKPEYFPDVMIDWACFAAGGFSALSSSAMHLKVANPPSDSKDFLTGFQCGESSLKTALLRIPASLAQKNGDHRFFTNLRNKPAKLGANCGKKWKEKPCRHYGKT
ncbi:hypothetical protein [Pantoea agglomerans]|uniref:hypothetical protein n=1 Tax=Enterobacter agglomerans TaxID=549 RepID=UPI00301DF06D